MATKQIPYGLTDFERIRTANYYYVDKTRYIAEVERNASFFFLIRPRRFGKSLFLNVLRWYYDVNRKDSFEELFGDLYIGSHPTPEQGQYLVLDFNFAGVNPDPDELIRSFNDHCAARFREFAYYYERFFNPGFREKMESLPNADEKLTYTISEAKRLNLSIYLFIDEYDNFTNAILANMGEKHYKALTHGTGFFRYFFNKLKEGATGDGPIKRMFITGVSPVTMDDVTSGFNIGANMTTDYRFNGIIGFSEGEVREMLAYYKSETGFEDSVDDLINLMKPWYDNYRFSTKSLDEPMYNSDMVLYFISNYLPLRSAPDKMIDNNIRTDYNKLRHLIRLDKRFGTNASIIQEIVNNGETTAVIKDAFPAEDIAKPDNFKSLLYYFGLLSIKGTKRGDTLLGVPNLTVREQLYTYLIEAYREEKDIHRITASQVFHIPFEEVTPLQRRNAKAVNFGIVYGISSFGLSEDLSIGRKEAAKYIEDYFKTYPGIKTFLDDTVAHAKEMGYVVTLFGRRRPVPELSSSNFMQRSFGERVAMNAPIQGTAADIMKIAMIGVNRRLKEQNLKSRLVLQVHDELLIEAYRPELPEVEKILREEMEQAASLDVPLEIDMHTGENWYEAK